MTDIPVISVDGPSGTGKGTLCSYLAIWLGWHLLDSGALYRAMAYAAEQEGIQMDDDVSIATLADDLNIEFSHQNAGNEIMVLLNRIDISQQIRTEICGNNASQLAAHARVRKVLLARQRQFRQSPGLVADGRDMGTVVFPDATLKIYLSASPEARALRRHKQLKQKGFSVNLAQLSADIAERDTRDCERAISPLVPADDAVVVETTNLSIEEVIEQIGALVRKRFPAID